MAEIKKLFQGFQRFRQRYFEQDRELFDQLRRGQAPKTLVIACSDSRVDPALLTGAEPGDLFVIRNVANLVPPCESGGKFHGTSAALEFAICNLGVENIIVLGHAYCGGIRALLDGYGEHAGEGEGFIAPWVHMATSARDRVLAQWPEASKDFQQRACERAAIAVSLEHLMSFNFVRQRVESGQLRIYGWYFDIDNGELLQYDPEKGRFHDLYFKADQA